MPNDTIHIRRKPDDASMKPAWCGATGVATITEPWGYYGRGAPGYDDVCRSCDAEQRKSWGVEP